MRKALIISADDIKKDLPGYDPKLAEKYHHQSAQLADKQLAAKSKNQITTK